MFQARRHRDKHTLSILTYLHPPPKKFAAFAGERSRFNKELGHERILWMATTMYMIMHTKPAVLCWLRYYVDYCVFVCVYDNYLCTLFIVCTHIHTVECDQRHLHRISGTHIFACTLTAHFGAYSRTTMFHHSPPHRRPRARRHLHPHYFRIS